MNNCILGHVPPHLHWDNKPVVDEFFLNEKLFVRCDSDQLENPFAKISLKELSINRQGHHVSIMSIDTDVLINIESARDNDYYADKEVCTLNVTKLSPAKTTFCYTDETLPVQMTLIHDPLPCNYAHSLFRITYDGIKIDSSNYDLISKGNKTYSNLRSRLRQELKIMIVTKNVNLNI